MNERDRERKRESEWKITRAYTANVPEEEPVRYKWIADNVDEVPYVS